MMLNNYNAYYAVRVGCAIVSTRAFTTAGHVSTYIHLLLLREEEIAITKMMMRTARVELQIYVYAMFSVNGFPHH